MSKKIKETAPIRHGYERYDPDHPDANRQGFVFVPVPTDDNPRSNEAKAGYYKNQKYDPKDPEADDLGYVHVKKIKLPEKIRPERKGAYLKGYQACLDDMGVSLKVEEYGE